MGNVNRPNGHVNYGIELECKYLEQLLREAAIWERRLSEMGADVQGYFKPLLDIKASQRLLKGR